jgi:hypothetical protein
MEGNVRSDLQERNLKVDEPGDLLNRLLKRSELHVDVEVLEEDQRKRRLVDLPSLVDEKHRNGRKELLRSKRLNETNEEVDAAMAGNMRCRIGESTKEILELSKETFATGGALLHGLDEGGNDVVEGLVNDSEAVGVVALENVGAHEGEDGDDVVHELVGDERTELSEEEEGLVVGLGVDGS